MSCSIYATLTHPNAGWSTFPTCLLFFLFSFIHKYARPFDNSFDPVGRFARRVGVVSSWPWMWACYSDLFTINVQVFETTCLKILLTLKCEVIKPPKINLQNFYLNMSDNWYKTMQDNFKKNIIKCDQM